MPSLLHALLASVALGLFSAGADWVWARWLTDGAILPGLVHGLLAFVLLALVLGGGKRRLLLLPPAGLAIAAAFYPLAMAVGYIAALIATWAAMWLTLACLTRRPFFLRGALAAVGSGLAFWSVSGMWTEPAAHANYALRFVYWSFAFMPGFLALLYRRRDRP